MSRARKLLVVSFVLALGIVLAWPFRKSGPQFAPEQNADAPPAVMGELATLDEQPSTTVVEVADAPSAPRKQIVAKMASTAESDSAKSPRQGFDLADRFSQPTKLPDLASATQDEKSPVTPQVAPRERRTARPAYATNDDGSVDDTAWPEEVMHVVRNGDTLEKLAQRYLNDSARALELFDLNRDQLTNPHLLPIGAELRVPVPPRRDVD